MCEPEQKCENNDHFWQNFTLPKTVCQNLYQQSAFTHTPGSSKLFIAFKMAYSCCFSRAEILDLIQKRFYNIDYSLVQKKNLNNKKGMPDRMV